MGAESSPDNGRSAVPSRMQQRERVRSYQRRQEEQKVREIEDIQAGGGDFGTGERGVGKGLYARSESGNIVRSSTGEAVTSTAGRQVQENVRAGIEGRAARDMSGDQPVEREATTATEDQPQETSKPKTVSKPSVASRRALLGAAKGAKQRLFY